MGGIIRNLKGKALLINGMADHVHLLFDLPPSICISINPTAYAVG